MERKKKEERRQVKETALDRETERRGIEIEKVWEGKKMQEKVNGRDEKEMEEILRHAHCTCLCRTVTADWRLLQNRKLNWRQPTSDL